MSSYSGPLDQNPARIPESFGASNVNDHPFNGIEMHATQFEVSITDTGDDLFGPLILPCRIIKSYQIFFKTDAPAGNTISFWAGYNYIDGTYRTHKEDFNIFVTEAVDYYFIKVDNAFKPPVLFLRTKNKTGAEAIVVEKCFISAEVL